MAAQPGDATQHYGDEPKDIKPGFVYASGDRPLEGYTIKRGLGRGGFGEVYYALSDGGKEVALKLIQRHMDVELRGVAHVLNLKSPHLISVYDVRNNPRGENWIIMEYMAGRSLQDRLAAHKGALPFDEAIHWLDGIGRAVDYLHENGIVHRDLKPGNVFVEGEIVKVGDYSLSKFISNSRRSGQTQSVGTVHYMAPEIATGNYGTSIDVYSAAVIAFEMLSGQLPFDGETAGEILMKHLTADPALEHLPLKYRGLFARALDKKPENRFATVCDLVQALLALEKGENYVPPPRRGMGFAPKPPLAVTDNQPTVDLKTSLPPLPGTFAAKRRAASELVWSMFSAGLLSCVLPVLALAADQVINNHPPDLRKLVGLGVVSGVASWGLLALGRLWETQRAERTFRAMSSLLFGFALGPVALWLLVWLNQTGPDGAPLAVPSILLSEELLEKLAPAMLTYAALFGLTFAIPDWARAVCTTRMNKFSSWQVVWPIAVTAFLAEIMDVADTLFVAIAIGLTAVIVQWVSPVQSLPKPSYAARRRFNRAMPIGRGAVQPA